MLIYELSFEGDDIVTSVPVDARDYISGKVSIPKTPAGTNNSTLRCSFADKPVQLSFDFGNGMKIIEEVTTV